MPPEERDFTVEFFRDADGSKPAANWLRAVADSNPDLAERCKVALGSLRDRRWHGHDHTKSLKGEDGLFEVRVLGVDGARLLFFFAGPGRIIIVHGFQKKGQAISPGDVAIGRNRMRSWKAEQDRPLRNLRSRNT